MLPNDNVKLETAVKEVKEFLLIPWYQLPNRSLETNSLASSL
jgi:hypothetical protein